MSVQDQPKVILASRSPRRQELLSQIGFKFDLLDIDTDETVKFNEEPLNYVKRMAVQKAEAAWQSLSLTKMVNYQTRPVLTADTSVVLGQTILGKPESQQHAADMIAQLSGQSHQVMTAIALSYLVKDSSISTQTSTSGNQHQSFIPRITVETSVTQVTFAKLSATQIQDYINLGEGLDKAGSYAIQGRAAAFVESIEGSYTGVVGLPLYQTNELLEQYMMQFKGL
jgi:septum formation protein